MSTTTPPAHHILDSDTAERVPGDWLAPAGARAAAEGMNEKAGRADDDCLPRYHVIGADESTPDAIARLLATTLKGLASVWLWDGWEQQHDHAFVEAIWDAMDRRTRRHMIDTGTITLPTGQTIEAGQGGFEGVGSDRYPVTIIGWSKSGLTVYYQAAKAIPAKDHDHFGAQSYTFEPDPSATLKLATWRNPSKRRRDGCYVPKGQSRGGIYIRHGYGCYRDPHF